MKRLLPLAGTIVAVLIAAPLPAQEPGTPPTASGKAPHQTPPVRREVLVPAKVADVWTALTTLDGVKTFFAPQARVELRAGGPYEIYFVPDAPAGSKGCEGCTVVSFEPEASLVVTWSFPPAVPALRAAKLYGTVTFTLTSAAEGKTKLVLVHDGFPPSRDGARSRTYFGQAWDVVTARLVQRFTTGPVDWKKP